AGQVAPVGGRVCGHGTARTVRAARANPGPLPGYSVERGRGLRPDVSPTGPGAGAGPAPPRLRPGHPDADTVGDPRAHPRDPPDLLPPLPPWRGKKCNAPRLALTFWKV